MLLTLDKMAERYGMLPSQVLIQGSTLDLYVMDAALTYIDYKHRKANNEVATDYSINELQDMIKKVKKDV